MWDVYTLKIPFVVYTYYISTVHSIHPIYILFKVNLKANFLSIYFLKYVLNFLSFSLSLPLSLISAIFGESLDIHTGGIDLAFPHHTNEIAQCEGCFETNQWANYFLHAGE